MLCTSQRQQKRISLRELEVGHNALAPSRLSYGSTPVSAHAYPKDSKEKWSDGELKALTDFILFHTSVG